MAVQDQTHKLTIEEFQAFEARPENVDRSFELIDGEIIEKMPSFVPSEIALTVGFYIKGFVLEHRTGYVTGEAGGYVMSPGNVFNPDVGYISKARLPEMPEREAPVPPDLAVEVKSPTDSKRALHRKAEKYLEFGTRLVWLVFPDEQTVLVYTRDKDDYETIKLDGILDGGDVLPGFTLKLEDIFTG